MTNLFTMPVITPLTGARTASGLATALFLMFIHLNGSARKQPRWPAVLCRITTARTTSGPTSKSCPLLTAHTSRQRLRRLCVAAQLLPVRAQT